LPDYLKSKFNLSNCLQASVKESITLHAINVPSFIKSIRESVSVDSLIILHIQAVIPTTFYFHEITRYCRNAGKMACFCPNY